MLSYISFLANNPSRAPDCAVNCIQVIWQAHCQPDCRSDMQHEWDSPAVHLLLHQAVHSPLHQSAPTAGSVGVAVLISLGAFVLLQVGLHKLQRVLARDHINAADAVAVRDAVDLVRLMDDLQRAFGTTQHTCLQSLTCCVQRALCTWSLPTRGLQE